MTGLGGCEQRFDLRLYQIFLSGFKAKRLLTCRLGRSQGRHVRVYGLMYDYVTLFTWYGHKILFYTVLTVVVSDLHYSTLHLQRQCLI